MDPAEALLTIDQHFSSAQCPPSNPVAGTSIEAERLRRFISGMSWHDFYFALRLQRYEYDTSAIPSFMSFDGLIYYLPSFLRVILDGPDKFDTLFFSVVRKLTPGYFKSRESDGDLAAELRAALNSQQKKTVVAILDVVIKNYSSEFARDSSGLSDAEKARLFFG